MALPSAAPRSGGPRSGQLEVTWARDGLLAWQPAASRTGGNLRTSMATSFVGGGPWSHTTIAHVRLPFGTLQVIGQHIAPEAFVTMGSVAAEASDSLRWFAAARSAAVELVRAGQVVPRLSGGNGRKWQLGWHVSGAVADELVATLAAAMPAVCAAAFVVDAPDDHAPATLTAIVLDEFVDVAARAVLRATGWRPDIGTVRSPAASAVRAIGRGLSDFVDLAPVLNPAVEQELAVAQGVLERIERRVVGLPVVVARLRLALPDGPEGEWPVSLELVDADDRSRWCTAGDVAAANAAAMAIAGSDTGLALMGKVADAAAGRLATLVEPVVDALFDADPAVDVDGAALILERFDDVRAAGIEVLVPEQLARRRPQVRATATAAPAGEGSVRFGAGALLDWQLVVDDAAVDEAVLARAAEQATTLLDVGGRWIRLEGADVRRALEAVTEHREEHSEVTALGLLRLAAELEEQLAEPGEPPPVVEARDGWLADLLAGLPDTSLEDGVVPDSFAGTLRHYQQRGLGWMQFLERLGLGGCLADDMGLGKAVVSSAPVLTPHGWAKADDIAVGDEMIGVDGRPHPVIGVYPQGRKDIARVTFNDGSWSDVSWDHLWTVQHVRNDRPVRYPNRAHHGLPGGRWRTMTTAELLASGLIDRFGNRNWRIPLVSPVQFAAGPPLPLDPYLLGALLGDGCLLDHSIGFTTTDAELLTEIEQRLPVGMRLRQHGPIDHRLIDPASTRNRLNSALRDLGLWNASSHTKFVPDRYLVASEQDRRLLLAGLLDTDGHVRPGDGHVEITLASKALIDGVVELVRSLGGIARVHEQQVTHNGAPRTFWRAGIAMSACPFRLTRKASVWRARPKYPPTRIIASITERPAEEAVCFAVDAPSHLFVVDQYVVTHNTPTSLAHLAGREGPHLVLCPLSVVRNWQQEAARFVPFARLLVLHGADRPRGPALAQTVAAADIVVTTYQSATRDIEALAAIPWTTVVLDEAQAVKNAHTQAAKAVRRLPAKQRIALTGTPVENRLAELWAILDVVTPGLLGSETRFREHFALPIERRQDEAAAAALRKMTAPFLLRRTKADKSLVPDLPDKVEQVAWATLTREQATMYQAVVDQLLVDAEEAVGMKRRGLVLAALTRLKQICNHPAHALGDGSRLAGRSGKLARFDELVTDLLDAEQQALVFTQYRVMGELLARHVHERFQLEVPFLHGGVARASRDRMVARFQEGQGSPLLIVSLKAGGTGLNLTAASRVVHYDRWWNPAVEDQATDRAWRIGQTQSVFVHKLVCQGTVEERVAQLIDDKRALANAVVGAGGEQWLSEMSTDELRGLVTLDRAAVGP